MKAADREHTASSTPHDRLTPEGTRRLGFPLGEIAEILALRDRGRAPCDYVCELLARRHADDRAIAQPTELKRDLAALQRRAEHLPRPPAGDGRCHILQADHSS